MSAFSVSDNHINALVTFAGAHGKRLYLGGGSVSLNSADLPVIGQILRDANNASITARYGHCDDGYEYAEADIKALSIADIINLCRCFEYQACEHPDWYQSEARFIIIAIERLAVDVEFKDKPAVWTI